MIPIIVGNETLRGVASFVAANEMLPPNTRHTEQERLNQQALRSCSGSSSCSKTVSPSIYDLPLIRALEHSALCGLITLMWPRICGQVLRVFVPKGQNEGSQVRSAWKSRHWRAVPEGTV